MKTMAMAQTKHRLCLQVSYRATYWPRPKIGIPLGVTTRAMPMGTSPTRTNVAALKRKPRPLDPTTLVRRERGSPRRNRSLVDKPEPGHPCRQRRTNRQICQQDEANARHRFDTFAMCNAREFLAFCKNWSIQYFHDNEIFLELLAHVYWEAEQIERSILSSQKTICLCQ